MRIATFTQTPFVSHDDKNMVYIRVEDWDMCNPYEIQLFLDDQLVCEQRVFAPFVSLLIPCCITLKVYGNFNLSDAEKA